jgi:hypothetical protein
MEAHPQVSTAQQERVVPWLQPSRPKGNASKVGSAHARFVCCALRAVPSDKDEKRGEGALGLACLKWGRRARGGKERCSSCELL